MRKVGKPVIRILGISGSARRRSYNTALLEAAKELLPEGAALEVYDVSVLPLYNQDIEVEIPAPVMRFKEEIRRAEAVLFATPEHNYSITAVLKNAIEWGNRPVEDNSWDGKPAAIMSASTSPRGGARAQLHLRQIMVDLNMYPINKPQLLVARAQENFDANLKLTNSEFREILRTLLISLTEWTLRLRGSA
ncbi:MAG: NAD(P)H-dependent oxidoreductase [Thaumarchaeota archaeon]|nr:MAG: NAD(P)H-dependent oxidoreductase [Nitrososphaerota archaeon]